MATKKTEEITKVAPAPLAIPADLEKYAGMGTESLGKEDVRPPRLCLAQAMSPQVKRGEMKYIEGLREGNLFNDLSGEVYGDGPVDIVVVTCLGARGVLFAPLDQGGGILEANIPTTDPRMQFTTDPETGERKKPKATKFYDYLIWLPDQQELMALSMKGTQLKVAVTMNSLLKLPLKIEGNIMMRPPAWARTFSLGTAMQKKDAYSWANFTVRVRGITPTETREMAANLHEAYASKNIVIEREPGQDDEELASDM